MDVTHYGSQHFLTLIDCGPTRFAIWRLLVRQDSSSVICELESIFYERGPPEEILTDNDTAFCSMEFRRFVDEWGIRLRHRCAYVPSGNSIAERCHRSVKRIAAKKACTIAEAVYRYNATPKDAVTAASATANAIHRYRVHIKGIDMRLPDRQRTRGPYELGDTVWVKPPNSRCTTHFRRGQITGIISEQAVLVNGTPRHVRDWQVVAVVNHPTTNCGSDLYPTCLMIRPRTPMLMPIVPMALQRSQMKKSRQSPFVGVPATNDHVRHATCVILRPGGSVHMKVGLTAALDKRGFVCVWCAGQ